MEDLDKRNIYVYHAAFIIQKIGFLKIQKKKNLRLNFAQGTTDFEWQNFE